ncbi:hypothetical protein A2U01_0075816, partial [Trifolium medium]|nr:hypothetical protein [Trifolium medium]
GKSLEELTGENEGEGDIEATLQEGSRFQNAATASNVALGVAGAIISIAT